MPDYYKKMPSVKKRFPEPEVTEQYEQPIGPPKPTAMQRFESEHQFISGAAHRVKDAAVSGGAWMKKRGQEIQREAPRTMPREPMAGLPRDPFGMGSSGNPFRSGPMTGPFMDRAGPIQPPRRKGKRRRRRDDDDEPASPFSNPFHIPKSMRHLF